MSFSTASQEINRLVEVLLKTEILLGASRLNESVKWKMAKKNATKISCEIFWTMLEIRFFSSFQKSTTFMTNILV